MIKKVSKESLNISEEKIEELKKVIPEVFTEGKIDFEKLQRTLGKEIDGKDEKYSFNWAGRKETFKNIQTTAKGTLKPAEKESVDFDKTENLFIEGDNLEVLKLLQKAYFNKIKMIYIDPPYNTGKDFVYKDNFKNNIQSYLEQTGQSNGDGVKLTTNPETNGRFHSDWISMIYSRLFIARNLLKEDGVIFVSIDDNEVTNLRKVMDEVFGEENFLGQIAWQHSVQPKGYVEKFSIHHNYILCYQKSDKFNLELQERTEEHNKNYSNPDNDPNGLWRAGDVRTPLPRPNLQYDIETPLGKTIKPPKNGWRWSKSEMNSKISKGEVIFNKEETKITRKIYLNSVSGRAPESLWLGKDVGTTREATQELKKLFGSEVPFDTPKPSRLLEKILELSTNKDEDCFVLDFFAGSGTMAQAIFNKNIKDNGKRKFILVQIPEPTIKKSKAYEQGYKFVSEIGKERIRRVIKQIEKEQKEKSKQKKLTKEKEVNLDLGFKVFKLDKSNYKIWEKYEGKDGKELKKQLELFKTPLISGYKNEAVIYECIIKEGYSLNSKIEKTDVKSNKVFKVTDGDLFFYISLDQEIKDKTITELKLKKENMFICLDEALNDSKKKNLSIQCNLKVI